MSRLLKSFAAFAASLVLATLPLTAQAGHSLRFFGTGSGDIDRVKIPLVAPGPGSRPVNVGDDFTVELWLKAMPGQNAGTVAGGAGAGWINGNIVLDRNVDGGGDFGDWGVALGGGHVAFGVAVGASGYTLLGATAIDDGAWHHVAVTRTSDTGALAIYVDGRRDASVERGPTGNAAYRVARPSSLPNSDPFLVIGAEKHDAGGTFPSFRGWIDELRISSGVRYANDFARPSLPFVADAATLALYHFDEGGGDTLFDRSGAAGGPSHGELQRGGGSNGPAWSLETPFASSIQDVEIRSVVGGLSNPVDIAAPPDGSGRLFVVQSGGAIRIIENGTLLSTPFLSLDSSIVLSGGEQGLLSLAFHPNYAANGLFFVYYTASSPSGAVTIARYSRSTGNPRVANPTSGTILLQIPHDSFTNHNGGKLLFGPDGYLYISVGDGGSGNDPLNSGQTLATRLGKLMRIDVDTGSPYAIPADNPFAGNTCTAPTSGICPETFAYGLRNPWKMSFDRLTNDLLIGDVGQDQREEIDLLPWSSAGGENFGWRIWEGTRCNTSVGGVTTAVCNATPQTPPIMEYDHSASGAGTGFCGGSVTGGFRYRGAQVGGLDARYLFSDYCTGRLWHSWLDNVGTWQRAIFADTSFHITTFGEDSNGELLFASGDTIYRFAAWNGRLAQLPNFNGDGRADLVWRNRVTGQTALWLMNGTGTIDTATLQADSNWSVTHTGDLNGGGSADLIWRHRIDGRTAAWLMNGTTPGTSAVLLADPNWAVTHVADFNGDGRQDLLWRNSASGQTAIWLMNGLGATSSAIILNDPQWSVVTTGDLNGDGRADLVWRNANSGATAVWLMNGLGKIAAEVIFADPAWAVTGVGDFNLDGRADLVWRNDTTGATAIWLMNGIAADAAGTVLVDTNWFVTHVADLSGDGKADLIWRNRGTGMTAVWTMNGLVPVASAYLTTDANWAVIQTGDLNADSRADLVWANGASGQSAVWLMNGVAPSSSALLGAPLGWSVQ